MAKETKQSSAGVEKEKPAMTAVAQSRSSGCVLVIVAVGLLALLLLAIPTQAPRIIQTRPHAVERHGADALTAREKVSACEHVYSRWIGKKQRGWAYWCETGTPLCPGIYITAGGIEKTAFIQPCVVWRGAGQ